MEKSFVWTPKMTKVFEKTPVAFALNLAVAIMNYGTYGEEPELDYPESAIFEALREDLDNSESGK